MKKINMLTVIRLVFYLLRPPGNNRRHSRLSVFPIFISTSSLFLGLISFLGQSAYGQLIPDNTLGGDSSQVMSDIVLPGGTAELIQNGAIQGNLLFHSFLEFNVAEGQQVYFTNPVGISDIFSRVTGENVSNIDGVLGVDGIANLFFLNPNGILFGPDAELDLQGSFLASTGDSFIFGNGERFSATEPGMAPQISVSVPLGVQYGPTPGPITVSESILEASPGETLALIGGNIDLDFVELIAPAGQIEIGAVANTTVNVSTSDGVLNVDIPANFLGQDIQIINSEITTYPDDFGDTGNLEIVGRTAVIRDSYLETSTEDGNSGSLLIDVIDSLTIDFSEVYSDVFLGIGTGGDLRVSAGSALIRDSILQSAADEGDAGDLVINAGSAEITGTTLESSIFEGNAGDLTIITTESLLVDESDIFSDVLFGPGNGGRVQIDSGSAQFRDSTIFTSAIEGNAGSLDITANDTLEINATELSSDASFGSGGDINLVGKSVFIFDESRINTSVDQGQGDSGSIDIIAIDSASIEDSEIVSGIPQGVFGDSGDVSISSDTINISRSTLNNILTGEGSGGDITLDVQDIISIQNSVFFNNVATGGIGDGGDIQIRGNLVSISESQLQAQTDGRGDAGTINIYADDSINLINFQAFSSVFENAEGNGGDINIEANSLSLADSQLASIVDGVGDVGDVVIQVDRLVEFLRSGIFSSVNGIGNAGLIKINADSLIINPGALINGVVGIGTVGTIDLDIQKLTFFSGGGIFNNLVGTGVGGNVFINTGDLILTNGAQIFSSTEGNGPASNVFINANNRVVVDGIGEVEVRSSSIFSSSEESSTGPAGNITINSPYVLVSDSGVINAQTETSKRGGNLTINAGILELVNGGQIVTSTTGIGQAGDIQLNIDDEITIEGFNQNYNQFINDPSLLRIDTQGAESGLYASGAKGASGNILVNTNRLNIQDRAQIAVNSEENGLAGGIQIVANGIFLSDQARLTAETLSSSGGNIDLLIEDLLAVGTNSEISASTSNGLGGTITITGADLVRLTESSRIAVEALDSNGAAGNLIILAERVDLDAAELSATTQASADGDSANISLQNLDLLLLRNGSLIIAEAFNEADGGNIDIDADIVLAVPTENSDIIANALFGNGGRITLTGDRILGLTPRNGLTTEQLRSNISSDVSASSQSGQPGEIVVENLGLDPSEGLAELPVLSSAPDVQQDCLAVNESGTSSFVVTGRGGLPASPTDLLNPDISLVDLGPIPSAVVTNGESNTIPTFPGSGIDAQGLIKDTDGQIYFVAQMPEPSSQLKHSLMCTRL